MQQQSYFKATISHELALALIQAAVESATEQGIVISAAVIDTSGVLKGFVQMDDAPLVSVELSQRKAKAALLGLPSGALGQALLGNLPQLLSMVEVSGMTYMDGGLPVAINGDMVGAFAVGGATPEQDVSCAKAALAKLGLN